MEKKINDTLTNNIYRSVCNHYKTKDWTREDIVSFVNAITKLEGEVESFQELLLYFLSLSKEDVQKIVVKLDQELELYLFEQRINNGMTKNKNISALDKKTSFKIIHRPFEIGDIVTISSKISAKLRSMSRYLDEYYMEQPRWLFEKESPLCLIDINFDDQQPIKEKISDKIDDRFSVLKDLPIANYLEEQKELILKDVIVKMREIQSKSNYKFQNEIDGYYRQTIKTALDNKAKRMKRLGECKIH